MMIHTSESSARRARACLIVASALLAGVGGCVGQEPEAPRPVQPRIQEELPIVQIVLGEFDGQELTFRTLQPDEIRDGMQGRGDGAVVEALSAIPSVSCSTGCTGASYVSFSNVSSPASWSARLTSGSDAAGYTPWATNTSAGNCPSAPAAGTAGLCAQIRARSTYAGQQLERAYVDFTSLTVSGMTTAISMPSQPFNATSDFGVSPTLTNGLRRIGEIGRGTTALTSGGVTQYWTWTGTTTSTGVITFRFAVAVRGVLVNPTQRASLATGQIDDPASDYPARTAVTPSAAASSATSISDDGNTVVFATSAGIAVRTVSTGATTTGIGCAGAINPHISGDGSTLVFQGRCAGAVGTSGTPTTNQVYAYSIGSGVLTLVSRTAAGGYADGASTAPRVSNTGSIVVFQSTATTLNLPSMQPVSGCPEAYRYDLSIDEMTHVSAIQFSDPADPASWTGAGCNAFNPAGQAPDVSGDGNLVAYHGVRALDPADTNGVVDVYVYDYSASQGAGVAALFRVQGSSPCQSASLSADGARIAFACGAASVRQIYSGSSAEGNTSFAQVSLTPTGGPPGAATAGVPAISSTGRFVAFWSSANALSAAGSWSVGATSQVYVCDTGAPIMSLHRCWAASVLEPTAAGGTFSPLSGNVVPSTRIELSYPSDSDAGYVAYTTTTAPPAAWGSLAGTNAVLVSPIGDPRYQQPTSTP